MDMDYKSMKNCITNLETLIALDKRAMEDLKNNTHNIGQEEVLTIIREFIRCLNDKENKKQLELVVPIDSEDMKKLMNEIANKINQEMESKR